MTIDKHNDHDMRIYACGDPDSGDRLSVYPLIYIVAHDRLGVYDLNLVLLEAAVPLLESSVLEAAAVPLLESFVHGHSHWAVASCWIPEGLCG